MDFSLHHYRERLSNAHTWENHILEPWFSNFEGLGITWRAHKKQ